MATTQGKQINAGFFQKFGSLVDQGSNLLFNPEDEMREQNSDRVSGTVSINAASTDQATVAPRTVFDRPSNISDTFVSMGYGHKFAQVNPSKMIRLRTVTWPASSARFTDLAQLSLPSVFWDAPAKPAYGQSRYFAYVRCGYEFKVQVNAAAGIAGALVVYYVPSKLYLSTHHPKAILMLPHVIINLGTTSSCDLSVPYVAGSNYVETDSALGGKLHIEVWSPITYPTGTTPNVDVTILGAITDLDFQNPRPQAPPNPRERVDIAEGPGVMNLANRQNTCRAESMALDSEDVKVDNVTVGASKPIKDLVEIMRVSLPWGIENDEGFITWNSTSAVDTAIFEGDIKFTNVNPMFGLAANCFKYWRGSLVLRVTMFGTPFNKGRLRVVWFPNKARPVTAANDENALYTIMDLGLQSTVDLVLPYAWKNWMRNTDRDAESTIPPIGRLAIRVLNRLTTNVNCPSSIQGMVTFCAGEDFEMYCPVNRLARYQNDDNPSTTDAAMASDETMQAAGVAGLSSIENDGGDPRAPPAAPTVNVVIKKVTVPKSVHTDMSILYGRAMFIQSITLNSATTMFKVPLLPPHVGRGALLRCFGYFSGTVVVHLYNESIVDILNVSHEFEVSEATVPGADIPAYLANLGSIVVPPASAMSFEVPYYSELPVRQLASDWSSPFGVLLLHAPGSSASSATVSVWMSLHNPKFFFPAGVPLKATARSVAHEHVRAMRMMKPDEKAAYEFAMDNDQMDESWDEIYSRYVTDKPWTPNFKMPSSTDGGSFHLRMSVGGEWGRDISETPPPRRKPRSAWLEELMRKHEGRDLGEEYRSESGGWRRDLTRDGDVEKNPGPALCEKQGAFGILAGDKVLTLNGSPLDLHLTTRFVDSDGWSEVDLGVDEVREYCGAQDMDLVDVLRCVSLSSSQGEGGIRTSIRKFGTKISSGVSGLVSSFQGLVSDSMFDAISDNLVKTVSKLIIRCVCYGILFFGNPSGVSAAAVAGLLALDLSSVDGVGKCARDLCTAMVEGDVCVMAGAFADLIEENSARRHDLIVDGLREICRCLEELSPGSSVVQPSCRLEAGVKDFNDISMAGKNVQWWLVLLSTFVTWLKKWFTGDEVEKARKWLTEKQDHILETMTRTNEAIMNANRPGGLRSSQVHKAVDSCLRELTSVRAIAHRAGVVPLVNSVSVLIDKLCNLSRPSELLCPVRMEPVGIYIHGGSRVGKSYFYTSLINEIAAALDVKPTVFMHPVASDTMDLYAGQFFHVFDDFGQSADEKEVNHFCQIVSTPAFAVPMAWLGDKGMTYNSKVVIATSNRSDFTTFRSVTCPEALENRFLFKMEIRPTAAYATEFKGKRILNTQKAVTDNALAKGEVWEVYGGSTWKPIKVADEAARIAEVIKARVATHEMWVKQQPALSTDAFEYRKIESQAVEGDDVDLNVQFAVYDGDDDCPLDCLKPEVKVEVEVSQKLRDWLADKLEGARKIWARIREWAPLVSICTTVVGTLVGLWCAKKGCSSVTELALKKIKAHLEPERPYSGRTTVKLVGKKPKVVSEGFCPNEWMHMHKYQGAIHINGLDGFQDVTYFLGLDTNRAIVYTHAINKLRDYIGDEVVLFYNGLTHVVRKFDAENYVTDGGPVDLSIITFPDMDFKFASCKHLIAKCEGRGDGYLLHNTGLSRTSMHVRDITHYGAFTVTNNGVHTTLQGGIRYTAKTQMGMCGGVVVQKCRGTWNFVGIHVAGDGEMFGFASDLSLVDVSSQGVVVAKEKIPKPVHVPSNTKLRPSILYGLVEPKVGPAVLTGRDVRLKEPIDNLVKKVSDKFSSNVCNDDGHLDVASSIVTKKMFSAIGRHDNVDMKEAVNGKNNSNPIDMSTSPGRKYVIQGLTKRDLFEHNGEEWTVTPKLANDISTTFEAVVKGKGDVEFVTCLKDETRKLEKIANGQTRSIEVTDVDYVVAYRMVMGSIYDAIYGTTALQTGVAVGINPYTDFHDLWCSLDDRLYGLDYSSFDGRLPLAVMAQGVEVLASLHVNPDLVRKMHAPILVSKHIVFDECWTVEGGMPSGAPCTSVLNSVCNQLMVYAVLSAMDVDLDGIKIVCYGDDVLFSSREGINSKKFVTLMKDMFGMIVTSPDKESESLELTVDGASFLKRTFGLFPGTKFVVGVLDLDSMLQKIQWCRGPDEFKMQFESFLIELVLHGRNVYERVRECILEVCQDKKIFVPEFGMKRAEIFRKLFD
uniref:Genome polyprotein n=1 Tax=Wuhan sharpbelly picornavirus 1 TaxID=2116200 RepID=A0A2P1GNN3_9VIRU|nr:polyprotein [Wuhan sharpbelly picornavirus 1]